MYRHPVRENGRRRGVTATAGGQSNPVALLMRLQEQAGNRAVTSLIQGGAQAGPVIQRKLAHQTFKDVLRGLAETIGPEVFLSKVLIENANKNVLPSKDWELGMLFRAASTRGEEETSEGDDDRAMQERLIKSDTYGIGNAAKHARLASDKAKHLGPGPADADPTVVAAFQNSLFFRGERKDSHGRSNGVLKFDPTKHGRAGSARLMTGVHAEGVRERADQNLFVTKGGKEAKEYIDKAQGGDRELLTMIASKYEVARMTFDVDPGGYKTREPLTGILQSDVLTQDAKDNLNTWLWPERKDDSKLNPVLKSLLP